MKLKSMVSAPCARNLGLRSWVAAVALVVAAADVFAQQPEFDAATRRLLEPQVQQELLAAARRPFALLDAQSLTRDYSLHHDAAGRVIVGLFVEVRSADALAQLRTLGAEIGSVAGDIATVRLPLETLAQLETMPLARVHAARTFTIVHDSSMRAIRADIVRQRTATGWTGTTGAGAIVGIIDTGIDILHRDFHDEAGKSRVLGIWDHTLSGSPPAGFTYGSYCSASVIQTVIETGNRLPCLTRDVNGHGTHVAGSAAGGGAAGDPGFHYAGVAPRADLLIVRAGDGSFGEDRVADALVWLKREAQAQGRPAVVNLSFGHQFGPHDGTNLFERVIDALVAPGFLVVAAAGNDGENGTAGESTPRLIHARESTLSGGTRTIEFDIPPYQPSQNRCTGNILGLSLWYDVRDRVSVTIVRPNGTSVTARAGAVARVEAADPQGRVVIENAFPLSAYPTTAEAYIQIDGCGSSGVPATGRWQIRILPEPVDAGAGNPVDVYFTTVILGSSGTVLGATGFDNRFVVGSPGNARRAITVGAFATRSCWPVLTGGSSCYTSREEPGDLARFSSGGPTRDGRLKPEITAPGIAIISSLSGDRTQPGGRVVPGGAHWVLEGTSMAAPHVTGALALLLAHTPTLGPEDAMRILEQSARQDAFTQRVYDAGSGAQPRDWWGHGKLDVAAALSRLGLGGSVARVTVLPRSDTLPLGATRQLIARAMNEAGDILFGPIAWRSLDPGVATVDFAGNVRALQLGAARIVASADMREDTALVTVQPPAVLAVTGRTAAPASPVVARKGAIVPLLALRLEARGPEAIQLRFLGVELTGTEDSGRVMVLEDVAGDGVPREGARTLGSAQVLGLEGTRALTISLDTMRVPANGVRHIIVVISISGSSPNGSRFSARLLPDRIRTVNTLSGVQNLLDVPAEVASGVSGTTVLADGELFALSENPVRGRSVLFNFAEAPTSAAIYTVGGGRVTEFTHRISGLFFSWDLRNDAGTLVVPGIYFLVVRIRGQLLREKLMVLMRPGSSP